MIVGWFQKVTLLDQKERMETYIYNVMWLQINVNIK